MVNRNASRLVSIACRILSVASLASAGMFSFWAITLSSGASIFIVVVLGLTSAPYLMLWLACRSLTSWSGTVLIAVTLAGFLWLGVDAFRVVNEDAQGGLNLIFAPVFQLAAGFGTMCLAVALDWIERSVLANLHARSHAGG